MVPAVYSMNVPWQECTARSNRPLHAFQDTSCPHHAIPQAFIRQDVVIGLAEKWILKYISSIHMCQTNTKRVEQNLQHVLKWSQLQRCH